MKKAVIQAGSSQHIVAEGDELDIDFTADKKELTFEVLAIVDGKNSKVGTPNVSGDTVKAKVVEQVRADKVTAIRYKAKKGVHKLRGHKQKLTRIKITSL
jgi:large subunit ribosomal protein L21